LNSTETAPLAKAMIAAELKSLKTDAPTLRKFGLLVGGVFGLLALWFWWRHKVWWPWLAAPAVPLIALGAIFPRALRRIYLGWMALALVMGLVVSTILLTLFFYLVVTPIGLVTRLMGKDFLTQKLEPSRISYWLPRDRTKPYQPADTERQF
jgi:hypothetical protein